MATCNFVMHILSSPWFFRQNCHTSRIVLHGNATGKLSANITVTKPRGGTQYIPGWGGAARPLIP